MRARSVVRARAGTEFVCEEDDGELAKHIWPVEQLLNGDIRRPVVQHLCVGCCGQDGRTTRPAQIENVVALRRRRQQRTRQECAKFGHKK